MGGTSLSGGIGGVYNTLLGSLLLSMLRNGMNVIEDYLGRKKFVIFYLICGIAAAFTQIFFNPDSVSWFSTQVGKEKKSQERDLDIAEYLKKMKCLFS